MVAWPDRGCAPRAGLGPTIAGAPSSGPGAPSSAPLSRDVDGSRGRFARPRARIRARSAVQGDVLERQGRAGDDLRSPGALRPANSGALRTAILVASLAIAWTPAARVVRVDGVDLVAFSPADAERLLWRIERVPPLEGALALCGRSLESHRGLTASATTTASQCLAELAERPAEPLGLLDGRPALWFSAGVAVSALVVSLLLVSVQ